MVAARDQANHNVPMVSPNTMHKNLSWEGVYEKDGDKVEIMIYIFETSLHLETLPDDKRKPIIKHYENNDLGLKNLRIDLNKVVTDEAKKVHVLHSNVHLI